MNWNASKAISSYAVRLFVRAGGTLRYEPGKGEDGRYWKVFCVDKDGDDLPVIIARSGDPRILRSAAAVVNYHKSMFPDAKEVLVPLLEDEGGESSED